eukprot:13852770-Alexandrium_andersonii.AAC.1
MPRKIRMVRRQTHRNTRLESPAIHLVGERHDCLPSAVIASPCLPAREAPLDMKSWELPPRVYQSTFQTGADTAAEDEDKDQPDGEGEGASDAGDCNVTKMDVERGAEVEIEMYIEMNMTMNMTMGLGDEGD